MNQIDELIILHGQTAFATRQQIESWFKRLENSIPVALLDSQLCPVQNGEHKIKLFGLSNGKFAVIYSVSDNGADCEIFLFSGDRKGLDMAQTKFDELIENYEHSIQGDAE